MCFPFEPHGYALLEFEHSGLECLVTTNGTGFRCGYVRLPPGHPWHGLDKRQIHALAPNGGVTFSKADEPCMKGGPDDAWWIGFSSNALTDEPDLSIVHPDIKELFEEQQKHLALLAAAMNQERKPGMSTGQAARHTKLLAEQARFVGMAVI